MSEEPNEDMDWKKLTLHEWQLYRGRVKYANDNSWMSYEKGEATNWSFDLNK